MKVLFVTNLPSPYRVDFFNELGKHCDLTVVYERESSAERDKKWTGVKAKNYTEVYLKLTPIGVDRAKGHALRQYISKASFDALILNDYVSPAVMETIVYCRLHRIPYIMEYDGGFNKKDSFIKGLIKRFMLCGAKLHLTTANEHIQYLKALGVKESNISKYPFTSILETDLKNGGVLSEEQKNAYRHKLGMTEKRIILSVGRFSYENGYGKGYDVLLEAAKQLGSDTGVYIVGDEPTDEFIKLKEMYKLDNVHYIGFKVKKELVDYYKAADLFVLLTRGDIWGLVINEAMMYGLPVVTTPKCIAGTELVKNNINGYLVDLDDVGLIVSRITSIINDREAINGFSLASYEGISAYTIENMAAVQYEALQKNYEKK